VATEPQDAQRDIRLPDWLPPVVKSTAIFIFDRELTEGAPDDIEVLNRLSSDSRMHGVWRELKRNTKSNSSKRYLSPYEYYPNRLAEWKRTKASELRRKRGAFNEATARLVEGEAQLLERKQSPTEAPWPEQDCALSWFFICAYEAAKNRRKILSRAEIDQLMKEFLTTSKQLEGLSETLRSFGMEKEAAELKRIASDLVHEALNVEPDAELRGHIFKRERTDPELRSYVIRIATVNRVMFGAPLYGTVGATTEVALDLKKNTINGHRVREILRSISDTGLGFQEPWD
jgi:hypothetical protein